MDIEQRIRRRIRRIDATSRWSRMNGWKGMIPTPMAMERQVLVGLLA